jgi:hypothetical protein
MGCFSFYVSNISHRQIYLKIKLPVSKPLSNAFVLMLNRLLEIEVFVNICI